MTFSRSRFNNFIDYNSNGENLPRTTNVTKGIGALS